jgi:hypothetical protein
LAVFPIRPNCKSEIDFHLIFPRFGKRVEWCAERVCNGVFSRGVPIDRLLVLLPSWNTTRFFSLTIKNTWPIMGPPPLPPLGGEGGIQLYHVRRCAVKLFCTIFFIFFSKKSVDQVWFFR